MTIDIPIEKLPNKPISLKSNHFIEMYLVKHKIDTEIMKLLSNLSQEEKREVFDWYRKNEELIIPDYININEAAEILEITPKDIRKLCANNDLIGWETIPGSGKWRVETAQLFGGRNWNAFVQKYETLQKQSNYIINQIFDSMNNEED